MKVYNKKGLITGTIFCVIGAFFDKRFDSTLRFNDFAN